MRAGDLWRRCRHAGLVGRRERGKVVTAPEREREIFPWQRSMASGERERATTRSFTWGKLLG